MLVNVHVPKHGRHLGWSEAVPHRERTGDGDQSVASTEMGETVNPNFSTVLQLLLLKKQAKNDVFRGQQAH